MESFFTPDRFQKKLSGVKTWNGKQENGLLIRNCPFAPKSRDFSYLAMTNKNAYQK